MYCHRQKFMRKIWEKMAHFGRFNVKSQKNFVLSQTKVSQKWITRFDSVRKKTDRQTINQMK